MTRFPGIGKTSTPNFDDGDWATEGEATNPNANDVLADTGQLAVGIYDFDIFFDSSVAAAGYLLHRNAADDSNIAYHAIFCAATLWHVNLHIRGRKMAANERLRITSYGNYVGQIQATIIWVRRT